MEIFLIILLFTIAFIVYTALVGGKIDDIRNERE